jgi:hypothetical protein
MARHRGGMPSISGASNVDERGDRKVLHLHKALLGPVYEEPAITGRLHETW